MVKISKISSFVVVLFLLLESCAVGFNEFQNSYKTNRLNFAYCDALKLSGYYSGEKKDVEGEEYTETMFIYADGTVFSPSFLPSKSLLDGSFINKYFAHARETKYAWGY